jgi:hypothetical protein
MGAAEGVEEIDAFEAPRRHLTVMEKRLSSSDMMKASHSELEEYLIEEGRELQRRLLQAHLELRAAREQVVPVTGADGIRRKTRRASERALLTLVGRVEVERTAYQAHDTEGLHPLDGTLNLPEELYSHGIRRVVAEHAARSSFDEVVALLEKQTGAPVRKRQVEELSVRAAQDFESFYTAQQLNGSAREHTKDILVLTFDAKGVTVRPEDLRPATQKAAARTTRKLSTRLTKGEKRNRKRMAQVAAVYSVAPWVRTPMDVLDGLRPKGEKAQERPKVENKRVWASITHSPAKVIDEAFREALARDPGRKRRWIVLVDGNADQLNLVKKAAKKHGVEVTIVLDIIHVLGYLWNVAHAIYGDGTVAGETWVTTRLMWLLQGRRGNEVAADILRSMRRMESSQSGSVLAAIGKRGIFERAAEYMKKHRFLMNYADYIQAGFPIATGVIEGACRYLVKDRMDRTGARWSLSGAEAVLRLRALVTSGDMDDYWPYHLAQEQERNHASRYADKRIPDPTPSRPLRRLK